MDKLTQASLALAASLIPLVAVMAFWHRSTRRNAPTHAPDAQEWMRIIDKGHVIGTMGEQPIYDWLRVELSNGAICHLTPEVTPVPPDSKRVRLVAGQVTYWGSTPRDGFSPSTMIVVGGAHTASRRSEGFSLIEVLIVVVILGILTAIAMTMYARYVQESAAKALPPALMQLGQQLDQYAQDHNTYVGACNAPPVVPNAQLSCPVVTSNQYTVMAKGTGPIEGLVYTLTNQGIKATLSAPPGWPTSSTCWIVDAQGDCA